MNFVYKKLKDFSILKKWSIQPYSILSTSKMTEPGNPGFFISKKTINFVGFASQEPLD